MGIEPTPKAEPPKQEGFIEGFLVTKNHWGLVESKSKQPQEIHPELAQGRR